MTQMMNQQRVLFLFHVSRKHNELGRTNLFKYNLNNVCLLNYCKQDILTVKFYNFLVVIFLETRKSQTCFL